MVNNIHLVSVNWTQKNVYIDNIAINLILKRTFLIKIWKLYDISNHNKKILYKGTISAIIKYINDNKQYLSGFSIVNDKNIQNEEDKEINNTITLIREDLWNIKPIYAIVILSIIIILFVVWFILRK